MQHFFKPIIPLVFALLCPALSNAQSYANPTLASKILANPSSRLIVLYQEPLDILEIKEYRKNPEMAAWYKEGVQFWAVDAADGQSILGSAVSGSPMYKGGRRHTFFEKRIRQVAGE